MVNLSTLHRANAANIGSEIGKDLGQMMISRFQSENPDEIAGYSVGRNILDQILRQPLCVGLKVYNAINESGQKTLVFVGMDNTCQPILSYTELEKNGSYVTKIGIVADRIKPPMRPTERPPAGLDQEGVDWAWTID